MKTYTVTGDCEVSDGYHTMSELYDHRRALSAALFNLRGFHSWKSKLHNDGTMFEGYFVVGTYTNDHKKLITYHYALEYWDQFKVMELTTAPPYDGHTSQDVIERLLEL